MKRAFSPVFLSKIEKAKNTAVSSNMHDTQNARMNLGESSCRSFHFYIFIPLLPPRDFSAILSAFRRRSGSVVLFFFIANYANYRSPPL